MPSAGRGEVECGKQNAHANQEQELETFRRVRAVRFLGPVHLAPP